MPVNREHTIVWPFLSLQDNVTRLVMHCAFIVNHFMLASRTDSVTLMLRNEHPRVPGCAPSSVTRQPQHGYFALLYNDARKWVLCRAMVTNETQFNTLYLVPGKGDMQRKGNLEYTVDKTVLRPFYSNNYNTMLGIQYILSVFITMECNDCNLVTRILHGARQNLVRV